MGTIPKEETRPERLPEPEGAGIDSFEAIYGRFAGRVLNLAYRMTGNPETARDLAQEVWLRVFERLDTFESRSDVYTWIHRITVNHVLNHLKREKRVRWMSLLDQPVGEALREGPTEASWVPPSRDPGPDAALEADDRARRVWAAVQSLDPKYRVPLVLFHYEEQSYQQIADTMSLSMAAVETRIHRARKHLIRKLGPLLEEL